MATAKVIIKGEDQLKGPLKQAGNELTQFGQIAQKVGKMIDTASVILAIVAAVKELTQAVGACINEYKSQIEVDTKLNAVLKATNQQYKYSTKDIKDYASALQAQTRFADDAIESAAELLVATKKFDKEGLERTLDLSADLAEAMGTDITSAAQTLSKALQEPGEGLTRLKSIGITFTESEKNMITELRNAGKELEAQQVILDKVESAYGGVAKSIGSIDTSTLDKIKTVWSDIKENLGTAFQNALGPVFDWIYKTLRWLERLTSQVAERSNLNKYLSTGNVQALADNFTEDFLNKELTKRIEAKTTAYGTLSDNYYLNKYLEDFQMSLDEFLRLSTDQRTNLILKLSNNDTTLANMVNQQAVAYDEANDELQTIVKAMEVQHQDILKSEQLAAIEAANAAADAVVEVTNDILGKYGNLSETYQAQLLEDKISAVQKQLEEESLDDFVRTCLEEILENLISQRKVEEAAYERGSANFQGFKVNFDPFGLNNAFSGLNGYGGLPNGLRFTDSFSLLNGSSGILAGSDILELDKLFDKYASLSESYQIQLMEDNIARFSELMETYVDEDSVIGTYMAEILENLRVQLAQAKAAQKGSSSGSSSGGSGLGTTIHNIGEAIETLKKGAGAVFDDLKSQAGEAGDLISRLASNMTQFGPLLGAIITALHYVIEGLMSEIKDILNEFVQWGLEPLRELGRMIGQIITPIFEEIMPSVIASGKVLMNLFGAIARLLTPIVEVLMKVIGPILTVLADVIVSIVGTISWAIDWLAYAITWVLNKITFGWVEQTANPGALSEYVSNMMMDPGAGYSGVNSTTGVNAAYSGVTNIYMNIYQNGTVVGEDGISQFAQIIRDELADLSYYSR